jgi:hypothetical protein
MNRRDGPNRPLRHTELLAKSIFINVLDRQCNYLEKIRKQQVRFEVFTAVTLKNDVLWDINTRFVPHRRHITSQLQSPTS